MKISEQLALQFLKDEYGEHEVSLWVSLEDRTPFCRMGEEYAAFLKGLTAAQRQILALTRAEVFPLEEPNSDPNDCAYDTRAKCIERFINIIHSITDEVKA